jgi:hypothetical protein
MTYASSALLSHDSREHEAHLLVELMRLSPATVLLAEPAAEKSVFLRTAVVPLLDAAPPSEHSQVCVFFDGWGEQPLQTLLAEIRRAVPVLDERASRSEPSKSLPATLARWQHALHATFVIVFDRFEEFLAAREEPGAAEFENELVRAMNTPELRAHFLIALDEDAAPLLEGLRAKVPGLGDAVIRLPRAPSRAPELVDETPQIAMTPAFVGSMPMERSSPSSVDEPAAFEACDFRTLVGSAAKARAAPEQAFEPEPLAEDPARREPVLSKWTGDQSEQFSRAPSLEEPKARSDIAVHAPTRVPPAAWAVLGLVLVSAFGLLVSTVWQPRPAVVEQAEVAVGPAPSAAQEEPAAETGIVPDDTPPPSPADDQVALPSIKDEVPRKPASARTTNAANAQVSVPTRPIGTVYINVRSEAQRAWAGRLVQPLARRGIRVDGIRVVKGGPASADLHYFRREDAANAARLARELREVGLPGPRLTRVTGLESRSMPRHYELWLPAGVEKRAR